MTQPQDFMQPGNKYLVYRLQKAIYKLKHSGRAWYLDIDGFWHNIDLKQSKHDHNLHIKTTYKKHYVTLILYVDDIMFTSDAIVELRSLKTPPQIKYKMFALETLSLYIGLKFQYNKTGIFVFQEYYTEQLLHKFGMQTCNPSLMLMDNNIKLQQQMDSPSTDRHAYQSLVGSLIFMIHSRPDVPYFDSTLSRFMTSLLLAHMDAAKRVLRYL